MEAAVTEAVYSEDGAAFDNVTLKCSIPGTCVATRTSDPDN